MQAWYSAAAAVATTLAAPYVKAQAAPIKWRLQTYAGPALAEHVISNSIDWFNKAANGEMVIELYTADQLVPQGELFRAVQSGTIDAAQSDDDSAASPVDVKVFARLLPVRLALFARRAGAVALVRPQGDLGGGLRRGRWRDLALDRLLGSVQLRHHQADPLARRPQGLRVYTFPTAASSCRKFGVVPVTLPYEDVDAGDADRRTRRRLLVRASPRCTPSAGPTSPSTTSPTRSPVPGRAPTSSTPRSGTRCRSTCRQLYKLAIDCLALLSPPLVLGGRGQLPDRRQARADHDPGGGMAAGRGRGAMRSGTRSRRRARATRKVVEILKKYNADMIKAGAPYRY